MLGRRKEGKFGKRAGDSPEKSQETTTTAPQQTEAEKQSTAFIKTEAAASVYSPTVFYKNKELPPIDEVVSLKIYDLTGQLQSFIVDRVDIHEISQISREKFAEIINPFIHQFLRDHQVSLNMIEESYLETSIISEMMGYGPLDALLDDESINDILINNPKQVYVERHGTLAPTSVKFRDNDHLMNVISRIVAQAGRRVDEKTPYVDTRLPDGSRVNAIIPPLAIDGPGMSIRKFKKVMMSLMDMTETYTLSKEMEIYLSIAVRCKYNILVSGGTGSGKTTFLNALSQMIGNNERVVTIEDAAELQLQQPHVVRLETRPPSVEGEGEIGMRQLVINSLRMRPDRIILGEIRGGEAFEMLQAMNTGHDGSMCTIHASTSKEVPTRLANMLMMLGFNFTQNSILNQIAGAVHLIVQVGRMRDGKRRVKSISEVTGIEGYTITMQDIFVYEQTGEDANGHLMGEFKYTGIKPNLADQAALYGLEKELEGALNAL